MKSSNSQALLQNIDDVISDIELFHGVPEKANNYLAQFLIVYICGIYEEIIEATVKEMSRKLGNIEITNFIEHTLDKTFRNPNEERIKELFKKFNNSTWSGELKKIKRVNWEALNSIVQNKNSLAHGSSSLMLTIIDVKSYSENSRVILEKIDNLLL